jgi:hypothetical protein
VTMGGQTFTNVPGGTATWTFSNNNYKDQNGSVEIVINKADASILVKGYTGTYDAAAHGASLDHATGIGGVDLSASINLGTSFTDVPGATAHWTFTGGTNYNDQSGDVNIVIGKANATVTVNGYTGVYDGNPHGATGTAKGVKNEDLSGLNLGASFTTVPGGTAAWTFTDANGNYNDKSGTAAIVINKADGAIVVNGYTGVYDGNPHGATGTAKGVKGETLSGLELGASFTNVPGGTATWTFTDAAGNYNNATGMADIVISKADAAIVVNGYTGVYDGNPHGATGTAKGVKNEDLSGLNLGASFTAVSGGTATWTFTDATGNYKNTTGTATIVISRANATINVTPYNIAFDGNAHMATGTATGVKGESLSGLDLSATTHTAAGTYTTDPWTFTDVTGNYNNAIGKVSDSIAPLTFNGFLSPLGGADGTGGSFTAPIRTIKLGSTLPVKFEIYSGGKPYLVGIHELQAFKYSNATIAAEPIDITATDSATDGNQFRLTDSQWHFNLSTKAGLGLSVGTWLLQATLADGTQHVVWIAIKK